MRLIGEKKEQIGQLISMAVLHKVPVISFDNLWRNVIVGENPRVESIGKHFMGIIAFIQSELDATFGQTLQTEIVIAKCEEYCFFIILSANWRICRLCYCL